MILNRAIKMRIYPDDEQHHKIDVTLSHCQYIYNKMLERNTRIYERHKEQLNHYFNLICSLTESGESGFSTTYCGYPFFVYKLFYCLYDIFFGYVYPTKFRHSTASYNLPP